ncbi:hypothetical protein JCM10213_004505 [Rhodosporidiobolus nylandii]
MVLSLVSWLTGAAKSPSTAPISPDVPASPNRVVSEPGGRTDPDADGDVETQAAMATWMALLEPFKAGGTLPEKARTDPTVRMREAEAMTFTKLWQYLPFFARQSTSLTKAFVQHHLFGPPKPSWGVELTLFTTFLREVSSYSHLSSLARLRSVLELGTLLPTPKDGIVTPISFKVKPRNLRGILAEFDAQEDGEREIHGEWVTNKRLWRRMTREWTSNRAREATAPSTPGLGEKPNAEKDGLVCLYLHGGAYYMFSAETHRYLTISVSRYCEARVFAINYRLAPETRFPGQLHDAVSAYMRLTVDLKIPPENIILAGDSAGGGLCLALLMYLRDEGYALPAAGILMSPWCDLTMSCQSWETNRPYDYLPNPHSEDDHLHPVKCLLGDSIEQYLTHPYVSPLFGDFTGLPPLLVQAGDAEVLRDEITLMSHKAAIQGVKVEHEIFEDCVHVFQAFLFLEASRKAFQSQRQFVKHTLPRLRRKAAAATSHAPSPSASTSPSLSDEQQPPTAPTGDFDFAEVDREVVNDAHQVDQHGRAERESLPPTPRAGSSAIDLPGGDLFGGDETSDEELGSDEPLSDETASPPAGSPGLTPDATPTRASFPSLGEAESLSPSPPLEPSPSATSSGTPAEPAALKRPLRPILRQYASARDLSMTRSPSGGASPTSPSASAGARTPSTRKRRSQTTSTPASPRFASRPLTASEWPMRHLRAPSYPEFDELLKCYDNAGEDVVRAKTKVWAAVGGKGEME